MTLMDMSILKIYNKMHPTSSFFFTSKKIKNMSLRNVQSLFKRPCISISNVLSVSAYNTLTTKPMMKKVSFGKINASFSKKVSFTNFQFLFPVYIPTESRLHMSMLVFHLIPYL